MEGLEDRCLLSAPTLDPLLSQFTNLVTAIPAGKSLIVPLTASDSDGNPLTYTVTSSNSTITPIVLTGNTFLQLDVQWTDQNNVQQTGQMTFELFNDLTPHTAAFIAGLTEAGFYNNVQFIRVVPGFVIQGGDPTNTGSGGPGFQFNSELNKNLIYSGDYQLAMANSGPNTNGSQFFVTLGPQRANLDFGYTLFGQLIRGANVVDGENGGSSVPNGIAQVNRTLGFDDTQSKPVDPVVITSASVIQDTTDAVVLLQASGVGSSTITVTVNDGQAGTSTLHFTAKAVKDMFNDPPILGPMPSSLVTPVNTPVSFPISFFDFENDPIFPYLPQPAEGTLSVDPSTATVTYTPATNFIGRVTITVGVEEQGETLSSPVQVPIVIGVGDLAITAGGYNLAPVQGQAETYTLAAFTNGNLSARASDFTASINWGDDHLTNGDIVREPNGTFLVTGTNTYANPGSYPVQVTINGPHGAQAVTWKTARVQASNVANTVSFGQATVSGNEGTTVSVPVTLASPAAGPVLVKYAVTGGTATAGIDFTLADGTLYFATGQQTLNVPVVLLNDGVANETSQTVQLTLSSPTNGLLGAQTTATVTINKINPLPAVSIQGTRANVQEGASPAVVALKLSAPSATTVTVDYTLGGTAVYGTNYTIAGYDTTAQKGTVTFSPGQTVQNLPITILDDHTLDGPLTVQVTLMSSASSPTNAVLGTNTAFTYTIQNIDPVPSVAFTDARDTVAESGGTANLSVSLSQAAGLPASVRYIVVGGTATAGVDYTLAAGSLTFNPGVTNLSIPVTILNDNVDEPNATVQVRLYRPANATLGDTMLDTLTIQESGTPPTVSFTTGSASGPKSTTLVPLTVTLSAASGKTITVDYAATNGTPPYNGGVDYNLPNGTLTFLPGQTRKTIYVTVVNTTRHELNQTVQITLSNPVNATLGTTPTESYTIDENSTLPLSPPITLPVVSFDVANSSASGNENVPSPVIQVGLSVPPTQTVTVRYAVTGGTAVSGVDYTLATGTLTFQAGQATDDAIPLTIKDDGRYGPNKTVRITLFSPVRAILGNETNFTYTLVEDDPLPTVSFSATNPTKGSEATSLVDLVVTLSAPSGVTTTVDYTAAPVTGIVNGVNGGVDYVLANGTLTFLPGQTRRVIPIVVVNNGRNEANPTIGVTLSNPVNANLGTAAATYQILNIDPQPAVSFQLAASSTDEAATPAAIAVVLSAPSGQTVTVNYAVPSGTAGGTAQSPTDYTLPSTQTLTFAPGQTVQYIPVTIVDDEVFEANETLRLVLSGPTNARLGAVTGTTLIIVQHGVMPQVAFGMTGAANPSSTTSFAIPVTVTGAFGAPVTVRYTVSVLNSSAAGNGVDYTLTGGTLSFTPNGTTSQTDNIVLSVKSDTNSDADETVIVQLFSPTNAVLGSNVFFTYTITGS